MLGGITLFFLALTLYCQWRTGCGPSWLSRVRSQDAEGSGFVPDPCDAWRQMPLLDMIAALGLFSSGVAFVLSLTQDLWRFLNAGAWGRFQLCFRTEARGSAQSRPGKRAKSRSWL